jgi:type IX secretion system PorP/SprF family membrane protein
VNLILKDLINLIKYRAIRYFAIFWLLILFTINSTKITAQDIHFTQFFANKLYLAPSFAGSTLQNRFYSNYRIQWPGLPKSYTTYCASFDHYFHNFNSGLGMLFARDIAGVGRYGTTLVGLQYSYDFQINDEWHIRPGIQFGYIQRAIDYSKLVLPYQITDEGEIIDPNSTVIFPDKNNMGAFDAASSIIVYSRNLWGGVSVDHLLQPNLSIMAEEDLVPIKTSVFGGATLIRKGRLLKPIDETLSVAFIFKNQADYRQLDMGVYWSKSPLVFGLWYRGIPPFNSDRGDMFAFLVGVKTQRLSIGYSYDFTISNIIDKTAGAHEISLSIEFTKYKKRKMHAVPCPEF